MSWSNISEIITFQITLYVIIINTLNGKPKKIIYFCPVFTFIIIYFLWLLNSYSINLYHIMFFIADIVFYFIFPVIFTSNIKKSKVVYTSLLLIGIFSLFSIITSFIVTFISKDLAKTNIPSIAINISLLFVFCFLSTKQILSKFTTQVISISKTIKLLLVFLVWELLLLTTSLTVLLSLNTNNPIVSLTCFFIFLIIIASCIVSYLLVINNLKSKYYKRINSTIQNNMNEQVRYYEKLYVANENLRKFRHDFNNLKIGLNTYLKANDTVGALNYLNDCDMLIETSNEILHTGHHIVDALFSDKLQIAKKNNISIKFEGLIPSDILSPVDLCIIFGNTLDNAIEACLKIENNTEKVINVTVKQNHDYIFITFTNPCVENVEIKNNTMRTTKENTEMHGIGLYSIKQILKEYDGHLTLRCENNIFATEIDFCISTK